MPGWINVPIRAETHERLNKAKGEEKKSFDKFVTELLNFKEQHTESPSKLDEILTELAIVKSERDELKDTCDHCILKDNTISRD